MALGQERGLTYINGYDHPDVIAGGSATLALLHRLSRACLPVSVPGLL
jgi:threonine dehydratase